jgi:hypothetical protein
VSRAEGTFLFRCNKGLDLPHCQSRLWQCHQIQTPPSPIENTQSFVRVKYMGEGRCECSPFP